MDHPFWRGAFQLDSQKDLQTILATSIKEVWIDNAKGLDVSVEAGEPEAVTENAAAAEVEATLARADASVKVVERVNIAQEAARAVKICRQIQTGCHLDVS